MRIALYMWILLLVESFDFRPNSQYVLVSVDSSWFCFVNMCFHQASLLSRFSPRYLTSCWVRCTLFIWTGKQVSLRVVNETWTDLDSITFIFHLFKHIYCRMVSSGLLRRVALVRTDVSEEPGASFIRVTKIGELGTTQAATSNRRTLRRNTNSLCCS
jgi:hypothetical protein